MASEPTPKHGDYMAGEILPRFLALPPSRVQAEYCRHPIHVDAEDQGLVALALDAVNAGKWIEAAGEGRIRACEGALAVVGAHPAGIGYATPDKQFNGDPAARAKLAYRDAVARDATPEECWRAVAEAVLATTPSRRVRNTKPAALAQDSSPGTVMVRGNGRAAKMGLTDSRTLPMSREAVTRDPWVRVLEYVACREEHGSIIRCSKADCAGWLHVPKDGPGRPPTDCERCRRPR